MPACSSESIFTVRSAPSARAGTRGLSGPRAAFAAHPELPTVCSGSQQGSQSSHRLKLSKVVVVGDLYVGKTSLIHRFCKNVFDRDYKATIGVDFEIERFEIAGIPYSLQIWDTAGQEKFKCIASAYYRGAQVIVTAFDLTDVQTLEHTRQWLEDALRENEPGSCFVFLVGTKKDLLGLHASRWKWRPCTWPMRCRLSTGRCLPRQRPAHKRCSEAIDWKSSRCWETRPRDTRELLSRWLGPALPLPWPHICRVPPTCSCGCGQRQTGSRLSGGPTGENVKAFFSRVAALAFEQSVLQDLARRNSAWLQVGDGDLIQIDGSPPEIQKSRRSSGLGCC
ncbi:ras-related protein Rab-36 isoform X2 [Manis pentadactyla]|uniref:ras-related protein Rab-36 isoform X2 n=1 Tax=Manis pentadactyla TaxID=143292 RepID=UPI00255CDFF4|nr:ras-related protein Rab-36 isoform X2 [Manis pentadactyla]XP_057347546.1 ras-related protein Rab-36 isoform X2 [Manis pentadactyla]XP_057347547.1 ras-related protein Rab-36 isoform X2 [Manis pentadactyla]